MRVDPNLAIGMVQEEVLCEAGCVVLHDGSRTPVADLGDPDAAFLRFCASLDPNRCFIDVVIPDDADRDVFFAARDAAESTSIHVQATVDTPERLRARWQAYVAVKSSRRASDEAPADDSVGG